MKRMTTISCITLAVTVALGCGLAEARSNKARQSTSAVVLPRALPKALPEVMSWMPAMPTASAALAQAVRPAFDAGAGGEGAQGMVERLLLAHFDALDTSGDGLLSREEIAAGFAAAQGKLLERLRAADVDGDQRISRAEAEAAWPDGMFDRFDLLDTDDDGFLSASDLEALRSPAGLQRIAERLRDRLRAADTNGDGGLDLAEAQTLPGLAARFSKLDRDGNGVLSAEELTSPFGQ